MPLLEMAIDHLEDLLCNQLNMWAIFTRIKKMQRVVDYQSTLKTLVKAKLIG